ncbi:uncharacterized protein LOC119161075 isoform X4 [Rhipicephalus microplus]|uniref:uncharacterized protein LOC119161075 isoform X4 n=1 Tax=Rhipicephalus microplus TaxID=6941 RepID=UPI003F6BDD4E
MGNGSDEMQFRELLGKLEALWTTEKFCEKQDDVWRLLKRDVPRRSRFTCDTVHDLLDILTDREVITPQETVLLKRLAAVFSVQEASEHIQAFRKIPLDQDTCSLCSAPCQAPLLYRTPVQEITAKIGYADDGGEPATVKKDAVPSTINLEPLTTGWQQ